MSISAGKANASCTLARESLNKWILAGALVAWLVIRAVSKP